MHGSVEGKRIAALVGDGFEEAELNEPRKILEGAGAIVTIVGVDDHSRQRIRSKRDLDEGQPAKAEELVADCTADDFDALLVPGGVSAEKIRANREVQRFVREFDAAKKPVFSLGTGAHVLISAQVTRGRILTGLPAIGDDIRNSGGLYRDQPVAQDGQFVSARTVADMPQFGRAMLERLAAATPSPA